MAINLARAILFKNCNSLASFWRETPKCRVKSGVRAFFSFIFSFFS
jgi:hypothetical protein